LPETPGLDLLVHGAIGGRDDADIHPAGPSLPEALELSVLEHPQKLTLEHRRYLSDLVQKQRPTVGHLKAPDSVTHGAR
jgi:hypothetical protein